MFFTCYSKGLLGFIPFRDGAKLMQSNGRYCPREALWRQASHGHGAEQSTAARLGQLVRGVGRVQSAVRLPCVQAKPSSLAVSIVQRGRVMYDPGSPVQH